VDTVAMEVLFHLLWSWFDAVRCRAQEYNIGSIN